MRLGGSGIRPALRGGCFLSILRGERWPPRTGASDRPPRSTQAEARSRQNGSGAAQRPATPARKAAIRASVCAVVPYTPRCLVRSRTPPAIQLCSMCRATPRAIRSLAVTVLALVLVPPRARRGAAALPVFADAAAGGAALSAPGGAAAGFDACGRLRDATGELWIRRAV